MKPTEREIQALYVAANPKRDTRSPTRNECRRILEQLHLAGWMMARIEDRMSLDDAAERIYMEGSRP